MTDDYRISIQAADAAGRAVVACLTYDHAINRWVLNPDLMPATAAYEAVRAAAPFLFADYEQERQRRAYAEEKAYVDRLLSETMLGGMDINDDEVVLKLRMAAELQLGMVEALKTWLSETGAANYVQQDIFDRATGDRYVVVVQKPHGRTPHEMRRVAEARCGTAVLYVKLCQAQQRLVDPDQLLAILRQEVDGDD